MTKKLLPTMIGAALIGGMSAASADVTVFGHIDTSIVNYDIDVDGFSEDDTNFVCTTCSVGFKGSEDLGNGLKAIFSLDFQYDTVERNRNITDRDQWVGLAGGFGKVRIGTISTVYKSHGAMIDPLYRTVGQARDHGFQSFLHSGAGEEGQGRATNTVRWDSADFGGLKVGAHYTLDSDESDLEDNNPFGLGGSYQNGGILVFADYITNDGDSSSELEAWKLGGKFSMDAFSVFAQYEDIDGAGVVLLGEDVLVGSGESLSADLEGDVWHIGGTYGMGNTTLYAAFGQGDYDGSYSLETTATPPVLLESGTANVEYDTWTIAAIHALSKRTSIYALYNNKDLDVSATDTSVTPAVSFSGNAEEDIFAVGIKHKF